MKLMTPAEIRGKLESIKNKTENHQPLTQNEQDWLTKGLMAIYECQTTEEKSSQTTTDHNRIGFNGVDAKILSDFATQWGSRQWLSYKQLNLLAKKLVKYSGQLSKIAMERNQPQKPVTEVIAEISNTPMTATGFYRFEDGVEVHSQDFAEEFAKTGRISQWTAYVNGIKYILIND